MEGGIAVFLENVRPPCDHDGLRARTHVTPVVNNEQTQHTRFCVSDHAGHVIHNIERRCDAYVLLYFVLRRSETNKICLGDSSDYCYLKYKLLVLEDNSVLFLRLGQRPDSDTSGKLSST